MNEIGTSMRSAIERLQIALSSLPQIEPKTEHYRADRMYLRTVWSQAGSVIVGKVHKREHFYCVVSGVVQVTTQDGVRELNATRDGPQVLTCPVGTKRAVLVLEDAWRITVHQNQEDLTDIEELEDSLVEQDEASMYLPGNRVKVLS